MKRNLTVIILLTVVLALPFLFRRRESTGDWMAGDPVLTVISPHNEAIRHEFGRAFSAWHQAHHGQPVKIDWRALGGTTEIMRYLASEYINAFRAWWLAQGRVWPSNGGDLILDRHFNPGIRPVDPDAQAAWETQKPLYEAFRRIDDAGIFGCRIDVFFGGGVYDHGVAAAQGLIVAPWPDEAPPPDLLAAVEDGAVLIPVSLGGEVWRSDRFFGTALSTFGMVYNMDRLADLGIATPPASWTDLMDPRYFRQLGVADPTKSGSIAKAFEMIVHEQCHLAVRRAGFSAAAVAAIEERWRQSGGVPPPDVPDAYQDAVELGWREGLHVVQCIGANARYFTDGAGKVPIDVSMGNAAAGLAIDFFGRIQAEVTTPPGGTPRMGYVTPAGGSSASADPISLLRGARVPELGRRFIAFVLSEDGQKLWNFHVGAPGGPQTYALRRLPIRRAFYPSPENPRMQAQHEAHRMHTVDDLGAPNIDPYALAGGFHYHERWTGAHFGVHRYLIRAMCMDAGEELRAAWRHILENGGPAHQPAAMALLRRLPEAPEPLDWGSAPGVLRRYHSIDVMREWTRFFRRSYREARDAVVRKEGGRP